MDGQLNARRQKTRTACLPYDLYTSKFANRLCFTVVAKILCGHSLLHRHILLQSTDNVM